MPGGTVKEVLRSTQASEAPYFDQNPMYVGEGALRHPKAPLAFIAMTLLAAIAIALGPAHAGGWLFP
jgi:hypothetical protein